MRVPDDRTAMALADSEFRICDDRVQEWLTSEDHARNIAVKALCLARKPAGTPQWQTALDELAAAVKAANVDYIDSHYEEIQRDVRSGRRDERDFGG